MYMYNVTSLKLALAFLGKVYFLKISFSFISEANISCGEKFHVHVSFLQKPI